MAQVGKRPLSPHLSVYRLYFTMVMSGLHRITGLGLVFGVLLLAWWLLAAAAGPDHFAVVQGLLGSWFGKLCLFGWTFSLFYHMSNGVRHMLWDMGVAMDIEGIKTGGVVMAAVAGTLTIATWAIVIAVG